MTPVRDEVLLPPEVAKLLRLDVSTLATWRSEGEGPAWFRIGKKKVAYRESAIDAWLTRQEQIAQDQQAREHRQAS